MKKYLFGLLLLPTLLFGKNNADKIKFEIITASINFLSTDVKTSPESTKKEVDCNILDYSCLKKFCDNNNIIGASGKVEVWKGVTCDSKDELLELIKIIITDLEKREYRKELPKFKQLQLDLEKLPNKFTAEVQPQEAPKEEVTKDPLPAASVSKAQMKKDQATNEADGSSLPLIAFLLSLIALGFSSYTLFVKLKANSDSITKVYKDMDIIRNGNNDLNSLVARKADSELLNALDTKLVNINNRLMLLENQPTHHDPLIYENRVMPPVGETKPTTSLFYAKFPDLDNGFSRVMLLSYQNGEQIYEIRTSGDTSEFNISEDSSAQKYALSDFKHYLSSACDIINQPFKDCNISTRVKGILSKSDGNWIIQSKAKIEFL